MKNFGENERDKCNIENADIKNEMKWKWVLIVRYINLYINLNYELWLCQDKSLLLC